jgi:hypothetical protein
MELHLSFERETKDTVRFQEDEDGQPEGHPGANVVGTLYMQELAWAAFGKAEHISVTIAALDEASPDPT